MDVVLRAVTMYLVLMLLFRLAGRRTLAEITPFDLILLLMIGEATQQALLSDDYSLTAAILAICTLIAVDVGLSITKLRSSRVRRWLDGTPTLLVDHGRPLRARLAKAPAGGRHPAGGARGPRPAAHGADQVCDP